MSIDEIERQTVINEKKLMADVRIAAFNYLARREHSRKELEEKIFRKFPGEEKIAAICRVLQKIEEENLQSDQRYAEMLVNSRINRGYGPVRIMQELKQKGVSQDLWQDYLASFQEEWLSMAARIREKKFGCEIPKEISEKNKQKRFLAYRGFSSEHMSALFK